MEATNPCLAGLLPFRPHFGMLYWPFMLREGLKNICDQWLYHFPIVGTHRTD